MFRRRRVQVFNKMMQQFLDLRRYLDVKPWWHLFKATKPWFFVLAQDDVLSKKYFDGLAEKVLWSSLTHDYSDAWPMVNLRVTARTVLIDVPAAFWQHPGAQVLGRFGRWFSFLKLLKRQRYLQPLNGVVLLFDFKLLLDELQLKKYLRQLHEVLRDLCAQSLADVPLYMMIDGVEDLQGFYAYMARLSDMQRQQAFGISDVEGWEALLAQLDQKILAQLARGQTALHNAELLRFPLALSVYRQSLKNFVAAIDTLGLGCRRILLCGIYFLDLNDHLFMAGAFDLVVKASFLGGFKRAWFRWCEFYKKKILLRLGIFIVVFLMLLAVLGFWKLERHVILQEPWVMQVMHFDDVNSALVMIRNLDLQWQQLMQHPQKNEPQAIVNFVTLHGNEVNQALQGINASLSSAQNTQALINLSAQLLNQQVLAFQQLQNLSMQAPPQLQNIFNSLLRNLTAVVFATTKDEIANLWANQVRGACHMNLVGFPFQGNGDVSLLNFNRMFSPNERLSLINASVGPLWQAFNKHGSAYGIHFVWPLQNLALMNLIGATFFDQERVRVSLQWTPILLSKNLAEFNLNIGGTSLMYQNGPRFSENIVWNFAEPVTMTFIDLVGHRYDQNYSGSWALLRLLQQAQIRKVSSNHYQVSFHIGVYSATYLVQANRGDFAAVLAVLGFRCD